MIHRQHFPDNSLSESPNRIFPTVRRSCKLISEVIQKSINRSHKNVTNSITYL